MDCIPRLSKGTVSKERAVYWGRHAQGDSSAGSVKRGSSISGPEACVCARVLS